MHALVYEETLHAVHMLKRFIATLMSVCQGAACRRSPCGVLRSVLPSLTLLPRRATLPVLARSFEGGAGVRHDVLASSCRLPASLLIA